MIVLFGPLWFVIVGMIVYWIVVSVKPVNPKDFKEICRRIFWELAWGVAIIVIFFSILFSILFGVIRPIGIVVSKIEQNKIDREAKAAFEEYQRTNTVESVEYPVDHSQQRAQASPAQPLILLNPSTVDKLEEIPDKTIYDYSSLRIGSFVIEKGSLRYKISRTTFSESFSVSTYDGGKLISVKNYPLNQYDQMYYSWIDDGFILSSDEFSKKIAPSKEVLDAQTKAYREYRERITPLLNYQYLTDVLSRQSVVPYWWNSSTADGPFTYGSRGYSSSRTYVKGYFRKNGTYVKGYSRRK